jgi:hypothetical protein
MAKMRILHLTLKREWFDQIAQGLKRKEFRQYKPYWQRRLEGREYDAILFRNGYASNAPEMLVEYVGLGRDGLGRNADYVIRLGRVIETKRWRSRG